jgi:hypothetical protein
MLRPTWTLSLMTAICLPLLGCGDKGEPTTADETGAPMTTTGDPETGGTSTPTSTGDAPMTEATTADDTTSGEPTTGGPVGETAADGEPCFANGDCMSLGCEKFRDLEMGVCVAAPGGNQTRVMGTLIDFITLQPIPDTEVRVLGALTALQNPVDGTADLTAMSDANGQLDVTTTTPFSASFGEVAVVQGGTYYTTATGIAAPLEGVNYGPMNGNHDMWAVPADKLTEWSGLLAGDAEFMDPDPDKAPLPLGERGGVVGFVRDRTTGMGVAGKKIVGADDGMTDAVIRYLSEDGLSFNTEMTGSSGIFVLIRPGLAEQFAVEGTDSTGSAGSALKAAFVLILSVDA